MTGRMFVVPLALAFAATSLAMPGSALPSRLDRYLTDTVQLTRDERAALARGDAVTRLLAADATKEVAVFGAIWINAPLRRYLEAVTDIERFESGGGFRYTKKISSPPRIEDFARLRLSQEDFEDLRQCRVGDCALKLGEQSLQRFRTGIEWQAPSARADADALMREIALDYVNGYLAGGNNRLAVYRDDARPTFVADEFQSMVGQTPELTTYMPDLRRYLLGFPKVSLPGTTSFLYWQETDFGLKPTIRISHLMMREGPEGAVVTSKMLYASHYFWTGLELRALLPEPARGPGFWFVTVNRSRSDGLSGFRGMFVRRQVRSGVQRGVMAGLRATRRQLETVSATR